MDLPVKSILELTAGRIFDLLHNILVLIVKDAICTIALTPSSPQMP